MCPSSKKINKKISDHRGNRFGTSIQCQINHNVEVSDVYLMSVDCIRKYDRYTMEIHPYSQENYTRIIKKLSKSHLPYATQCILLNLCKKQLPMPLPAVV